MSLKIIEKQDYVKLKIPRTAQDIIPVMSMIDEGIAKTGRERYSMTYEIEDIDYFNLDDDEQKRIFYKYSDILNSLGGTNAAYQLTIFNRNRNKRDIASRKMLGTYVDDGYDFLREAYNELRRDDIESDRREQCKYITVSAFKKNDMKAKAYFNRIASDLDKRFNKLQSHIKPLNADERLHMLYDFLNCGKEDMYVPYYELTEKKSDFKSAICPDGIVYHNDYFIIGNKYGRAMMLRTWSKNVKDDFIHELTSIETNLMMTLDILPLNAGQIEKLMEDKDSDVESSVIHWSNSRNARENRAAVLPRRMKKSRKILDEYTEDVNERDQKVFLCQITLVILADGKEQLEEYTESVYETASEFTCNIGTMWFNQYEGLVNTLPFGVRTIQCLRDCNTETTAMMIPFNAQKLQHDTGIPYGRQISTGEQVFVDRRLLKNGNEIVVGDSGSGKSLNTKLKSIFEALVTNGYMIYVDPDGEYTPLVEALGGNVVRIGFDSINAFDMYDGYGYGIDDPVKAKSNFIITLIERIINDSKFYDEKKKSITDRCVTIICNNMIYYNTGIQTLQDFYEILKQQLEPEATDLALALERHIIGSFNVFAKPTSVAFNSRIICFDLSRLDQQLKDAGMLVCLDYIDNILAMNRHYGVATYIRLDEMDEYLKHPASCVHVEKFYQRARKYGGFVTGIIQNVTKLLDVPAAKTMLKNSQNIIMMGQAEEDAAVLANMYGLSEQDKDFLISCEPGHGINKIGGNIFRFDGTIPKTNAIYQFINTDGHSMTA